MKIGYFFLFSLFCSLAAWPQISVGQKQDASLLNQYAVQLWKREQYDSALVVVNKAITLVRIENDSLQLAKCLNTLGLIYRGKGDPVKSLFYYEQSLSIFESLGSYEETSIVLLNLGIGYKEQAIYDKALSYLFESASRFEKKQERLNLSSSYNTIGNIFRIEGRYRKALEYHSQALKLRQDTGILKSIAGSLNNIGSVYVDMAIYDSALVYFNASFKLKEAENFREHKANTLSNIAEVYYLKKDYHRAEKLYTEAHEILRKNNNRIGLAWSFLDLAKLSKARYNFRNAEKQALSAVALAEETGASDTRLNGYDFLRKLYTETKDFFRALDYSERYIHLNDTILGEEKQKSLSQLEVKYETERKRQEVEQLNRQKEKTEAVLLLKDHQLKSKNTVNAYLILTLVLATLIIGLLLRLFRDRSRFAKRLDNVMRELHHRVKNNFQVLLSLFGLQLDVTKDKNTRDLINSNRNRIMAMMLIHSGLYFDMDATKVRIGKYIQNLVNSLLDIYELQASRISIRYDIDESLDIDVDKSIPIGLLINELVTNALKYACGDGNPTPMLCVHFRRTVGLYHLIIKDNGPGMDACIEKNSFGLRLAEAQVKQLSGSLRTKFENGLVYEITFK